MLSRNHGARSGLGSRQALYGRVRSALCLFVSAVTRLRLYSRNWWDVITPIGREYHGLRQARLGNPLPLSPQACSRNLTDINLGTYIELKPKNSGPTSSSP